MNKKRILLTILFMSVFIIFLFSLRFLYSKFFILNSKLASPNPISAHKIQIPNLTLDSIFNTNHAWTEQLPPNQTLTLITTGDVIPARSVNYKMTIYNDFTHPFLKTADLLRSANLTLINLEAPLVENCPTTNEGMIFCGNQRFVEGLKFVNIDVVNLANNHTLNYGIEGIEQTKTLLEKNNILSCGFPQDNLTIKQFSNLTLGFLGWDFLPGFDLQEILTTIRQAKNQVDLLIVSAHWGAEYQTFPAPSTQLLAHQMIQAGADLIVGNHPHWIQPIEIYQDKIIFYAHANFIFDQEWSEQTKTGFVAQTTFYQKKIVDVQIFPIFISDYNQPELLEKEEKQAVLDQLQTISKQNQPD